MVLKDENEDAKSMVAIAFGRCVKGDMMPDNIGKGGKIS
jgi:hypothetical protein